MIFPAALLAKAETLLAACRKQKIMLATAESCTGGLVAGLLTEIPGSSDILERGFIVYSNTAKQEVLQVPASLLATYGAVSQEVACAMAEGALTASHATLAISITGIAGPGGVTAQKPVGLVHFAVARTGQPTLARHCCFHGDRSTIRLQAVDTALDLLLLSLS